jgi:hypothetical protein
MYQTYHHHFQRVLAFLHLLPIDYLHLTAGIFNPEMAMYPKRHLLFQVPRFDSSLSILDKVILAYCSFLWACCMTVHGNVCPSQHGYVLRNLYDDIGDTLILYTKSAFMHWVDEQCLPDIVVASIADSRHETL